MRSRLPRDPAYWATLTDRIVAGAHGESPLRWWRSIAPYSLSLAIGAAAAVIAALLLRPEIVPPVPASPATLYGFAPSDPLAAPFVIAGAAPTMATLIAIPTSRSTP